MGILLMELVKLECRIAGLAAAAGLQVEVDEAMARADHYLRLRAQESRDPQHALGTRGRRFRDWLRGDT
jgi:hypothetical protein